jgi:hypothetical protein
MMSKRLVNLMFDLRHPWWTFTREVALLHCQRTGQKLVPNAPAVASSYNITAHDADEVIAAMKRRGL